MSVFFTVSRSNIVNTPAEKPVPADSLKPSDSESVKSKPGDIVGGGIENVNLFEMPNSDSRH